MTFVPRTLTFNELQIILLNTRSVMPEENTSTAKISEFLHRLWSCNQWAGRQ